jgi:hypothetical protein
MADPFTALSGMRDHSAQASRAPPTDFYALPTFTNLYRGGAKPGDIDAWVVIVKALLGNGIFIKRNIGRVAAKTRCKICGQSWDLDGPGGLEVGKGHH